MDDRPVATETAISWFFFFAFLRKAPEVHRQNVASNVHVYENLPSATLLVGAGQSMALANAIVGASGKLRLVLSHTLSLVQVVGDEE